jgi:tRNA pseudouridine38-40 synthase
LVVGKLIKIGAGTLGVDEFESYFIDKITPQVWDPAYPQGLFLSKVDYPYLVQPAKANFDSIYLSDWKKL